MERRLYFILRAMRRVPKYLKARWSFVNDYANLSHDQLWSFSVGLAGSLSW